MSKSEWMNDYSFLHLLFHFHPPHYCFYEYNEGDHIKIAAIPDSEVAESFLQLVLYLVAFTIAKLWTIWVKMGLTSGWVWSEDNKYINSIIKGWRM